MSRSGRGASGRVWATPFALALITLTSLVGALVADGVWDWLATVALIGVLLYTMAKGYFSTLTNNRE